MFIDWVMTLPDELKKRLSQRIIKYEEERKMKFISSVEELGIEKGMLAEAREMVVDVLTVRFARIPAAFQGISHKPFSKHLLP